MLFMYFDLRYTVCSPISIEDILKRSDRDNEHLRTVYAHHQNANGLHLNSILSTLRIYSPGMTPSDQILLSNSSFNFMSESSLISPRESDDNSSLPASVSPGKYYKLMEKVLSPDEIQLYVQSHCYDEACNRICIHFASSIDSCARQRLMQVPEHYTGSDLAIVNPEYYHLCCGTAEFNDRPCYFYTPQVGGPMLYCYQRLVHGGKYSRQRPIR